MESRAQQMRDEKQMEIRELVKSLQSGEQVNFDLMSQSKDTDSILRQF